MQFFTLLRQLDPPEAGSTDTRLKSIGISMEVSARMAAARDLTHTRVTSGSWSSVEPILMSVWMLHVRSAAAAQQLLATRCN